MGQEINTSTFYWTVHSQLYFSSRVAADMAISPTFNDRIFTYPVLPLSVDVCVVCVCVEGRRGEREHGVVPQLVLNAAEFLVPPVKTSESPVKGKLCASLWLHKLFSL